MVGDIHRILLYGGIFAYPSDKIEKPRGNLQILYKSAPMAFVLHHAGGKAMDEEGNDLLDKSQSAFIKSHPASWEVRKMLLSWQGISRMGSTVGQSTRKVESWERPQHNLYERRRLDLRSGTRSLDVLVGSVASSEHRMTYKRRNQPRK